MLGVAKVGVHLAFQRRLQHRLGQLLQQTALASQTYARARGEEIVASTLSAEVGPVEAAVLLAMSRQQVRKLMDRGLLEFRTVGTRQRIGVSSITAFLEAERGRRREAVADLAAVQNELGLAP